jgi:uncharacterized membrane protein YgcG
MHKVCIAFLSIFLSIFLFFQQTLSFPVQAFGANYTPSIIINTVNQGETVLIEYTISQVFLEDSRGIYLSLPKNQDGVWTHYTVKQVQKRWIGPTPEQRQNTTADELKPTESSLSPERYEMISEWDQMRIRIGEENTFLEKGEWEYNIQIEATRSQNSSYNLTLLHGWEDGINKVQVQQNGQITCSYDKTTSTAEIPVECGRETLYQTQNPGLKPTSLFQKLFYSIWPYLIILPCLYCILGIIWFFKARDPAKGFITNRPEFEAPDTIYPWQAQFLIHEGRIDLKNTLLSYILWLNHKKFIQLQTDSNGTIVLKKLAQMPNLLPPIFNSTVESMVEHGVESGILESKINPGEHTNELNETVWNQLQKYYQTRPLFYPFLWAIGIIIALCVCWAFVYERFKLKHAVLLGESYSTLGYLIIACLFPGLYLLAAYWGKLSVEGFDLKARAMRYKFYLNKAEKLKLDFSNNPESGAQKYLIAVPFAAAFGILPQFQNYIKQLIPDTNPDIQTTSRFYSSFSSSHFYSPPSSSSSSGSTGSSGGFSGGGGSW